MVHHHRQHKLLLQLLALVSLPIHALIPTSSPSVKVAVQRNSEAYSFSRRNDDIPCCDETIESSDPDDNQKVVATTESSEPTATNFTTRNMKKKGPKIHPKKVKPRIPVLQYHANWVCVNKPAQMTIHRSKESKQRGDLVVESLLKRQLRRKIYPVHRLDHRTSGALLVAFDAETCAQLHTSLTDKTSAVKEYVALVRGDWKNDLPETVVIDEPLKVGGVLKDATTEFHLLAQLQIPNSHHEDGYQGSCSLVLCRPKTGRTHQIRRHAFALGHPILGDTEHGDSRVNRWWRQQRDLNRLFLHCLSLDLPPIQNNNSGSSTDDEKSSEQSQQRIECVAPLSPELAKVLQRSDMQELWHAATQKDPRLALESYDEKGGTLGPGAVKRKRAAADADAEKKNKQQ